MSRAYHMPQIGHSIVDQGPLICGKPRDSSTRVTFDATRVTCRRCKRLNAEALEALEHARVQAKLAREREAAATIHYSPMTPNASGRALARCGVWSAAYSATPDEVTCPTCLTSLRTNRTPKAETNNMRILTTLFLYLAACGPILADDTDASADSTSTSAPTTADETETGGESTGDAGTSSTSGASTSEPSTAGDQGGGSFGGSGGTTGDPTTDSDPTTSGDGDNRPACFGAPCVPGIGCVSGLVCTPHPDTQEPVCATPCSLLVGCDETVDFACGVLSAQAECRMDLDTPLCMPRLCETSADCDDGLCLAGTCFSK